MHVDINNMVHKDNHVMFEAYVDGITKRRGELAGNIMDIVRYGIPTKQEFIEIRQELHDKTKQILDRGTPATEEERARGKQLIGMIRSYRAQHPNDPPVVRNLHHAENAEDHSMQARAPVSDEQAAKMITDKIKGTPNLNMQNIKMYVQRYMGLTGKAPSDVDFIAAMVHDNLQNMGMGENAEDRSVQAGGAIEDITDIQNKSVHLLKKHGFHVNKVSNAHAEQQGGPMVYMGKTTGAMHQVAEVDPQGMINEEPPEEYLANHVHDAHENEEIPFRSRIPADASDGDGGQGQSAGIAGIPEFSAKKVPAAQHKQEDAEGASKPFQYNAMTHLTQAANHIRHILQTHADDEAQVEHIIRMAQIILGDKKDYSESEYRKMLDGLIVILNRFIIVPMN